jgi:hypothetical protein
LVRENTPGGTLSLVFRRIFVRSNAGETHKHMRGGGTGWRSFCHTDATPYFIGFGGFRLLMGLKLEQPVEES